MDKKIETLLYSMNTQPQRFADPWGALIDEMLMEAKIRFLIIQTRHERFYEIIKPRPEPWPEYVREGVLMLLQPGLKTGTRKEMEQALKHEDTLLIIDPNKFNDQERAILIRLLK